MLILTHVECSGMIFAWCAFDLDMVDGCITVISSCRQPLWCLIWVLHLREITSENALCVFVHKVRFFLAAEEDTEHCCIDHRFVCLPARDLEAPKCKPRPRTPYVPAHLDWNYGRNTYGLVPL
jgi:hypothetical protein